MEEDSLQDVVCTNCTESTGSIYIECAECQRPLVNLCVQCFASGAECGPHKRTHNYRVRNNGGVNIFTGLHTGGLQRNSSLDTNEDESDKASTATQNPTQQQYTHAWCAKEEVRLLEAVERFNLGNFEDVGMLVNSRRSIADVKDHYDRYYLRGRVGQVTCRGFHRPMIVDETTDYSTHVSGAGQSQSSWFSPPIKDSVCKVSGDDLRLLAYMPYRDDFEKEWQNDAEKDVSKLLLSPDDDQLDTDVKLAIVDMYVRIVKDRRKMKALVRDYDLVPQFFKQEKPSKKTNFIPQSPLIARAAKQEKDIKEKLRKFAQLITADEYNDLVSSLIKEHRLKSRIEELQGFQKQGITTLEGKRKWEESETPKKRRRARKRLQDPNRKAHLRWERFKRWQKKLVDGLPATGSK